MYHIKRLNRLLNDRKHYAAYFCYASIIISFTHILLLHTILLKKFFDGKTAELNILNDIHRLNY